jgi:quercetin dioxygenase-like cupin family protein
MQLYSISVENLPLVAEFAPVVPGLSEVALPSQQQMYQIEEELKKLPQADFSLINRFADGLYARQVTIKKGCLLTSKIHLKEHFAFILTGEIDVWTDQDFQRIKAPCILTTKPGTKRVLYAREETVWITVHATTATDVESAERELVSNDPEMIEQARGAYMANSSEIGMDQKQANNLRLAG